MVRGIIAVVRDSTPGGGYVGEGFILGEDVLGYMQATANVAGRDTSGPERCSSGGGIMAMSQDTLMVVQALLAVRARPCGSTM